jgi:hypothetical protein
MADEELEALVSDLLDVKLQSFEKRLGRIETVLDIRNGDFHGSSILVERQLDEVKTELAARISNLEMHQNITGMQLKKKAASKKKVVAKKQNKAKR